MFAARRCCPSQSHSTCPGPHVAPRSLNPRHSPSPNFLNCRVIRQIHSNRETSAEFNPNLQKKLHHAERPSEFKCDGVIKFAKILPYNVKRPVQAALETMNNDSCALTKHQCISNLEVILQHGYNISRKDIEYAVRNNLPDAALILFCSASEKVRSKYKLENGFVVNIAGKGKPCDLTDPLSRIITVALDRIKNAKERNSPFCLNNLVAICTKFLTSTKYPVEEHHMDRVIETKDSSLCILFYNYASAPLRDRYLLMPNGQDPSKALTKLSTRNLMAK